MAARSGKSNLPASGPVRAAARRLRSSWMTAAVTSTVQAGSASAMRAESAGCWAGSASTQARRLVAATVISSSGATAELANQRGQRSNSGPSRARKVRCARWGGVVRVARRPRRAQRCISSSNGKTASNVWIAFATGRSSQRVRSDSVSMQLKMMVGAATRKAAATARAPNAQCSGRASRTAVASPTSAVCSGKLSRRNGPSGSVKRQLYRAPANDAHARA